MVSSAPKKVDWIGYNGESDWLLRIANGIARYKPGSRCRHLYWIVWDVSRSERLSNVSETVVLKQYSVYYYYCALLKPLSRDYFL